MSWEFKIWLMGNTTVEVCFEPDIYYCIMYVIGLIDANHVMCIHEDA